MDRKFGALLVDIQASLLVQDFTVHTQAEVLICGNTCCVHDKHDKCIVSSSNVFTDSTIYRKMMISFSDNTLPISLLLSKALLIAKVISESAFNIKSAFDTKSAFRYHFWKQKCKVGAFGKRMSMTTFGSRLSTCNRVLQKERLLTYGVISPGQSRGISPLQVVAELVLSLLL